MRADVARRVRAGHLVVERQPVLVLDERRLEPMVDDLPQHRVGRDAAGRATPGPPCPAGVGAPQSVTTGAVAGKGAALRASTTPRSNSCAVEKNIDLSVVATNAPEKFNVQFFGQNLADKIVFTSTTANTELFGMATQVYLNEPRT